MRAVRPATLLKRDSKRDVFLKYCKISNNTCFEEHLRTAASENNKKRFLGKATGHNDQYIINMGGQKPKLGGDWPLTSPYLQRCVYDRYTIINIHTIYTSICPSIRASMSICQSMHVCFVSILYIICACVLCIDTIYTMYMYIIYKSICLSMHTCIHPSVHVRFVSILFMYTVYYLGIILSMHMVYAYGVCTLCMACILLYPSVCLFMHVHYLSIPYMYAVYVSSYYTVYV